MNAAPELLEAAAQGDEQACEQMLRENSGLIWSIVRRYYGRGVEPDDLYQLGCLGFIKAIKGFDLHSARSFQPTLCRRSRAKFDAFCAMTVQSR